MQAVVAERQRSHPGNVAKPEDAVKMREKRAAARRFPFQSVAEIQAIDRNQQQIHFAGEMLRSRFANLVCGRKMNIAVGKIDGSSLENAFFLGFPP